MLSLKVDTWWYTLFLFMFLTCKLQRIPHEAPLTPSRWVWREHKSILYRAEVRRRRGRGNLPPMAFETFTSFVRLSWLLYPPTYTRSDFTSAQRLQSNRDIDQGLMARWDPRDLSVGCHRCCVCWRSFISAWPKKKAASSHLGGWWNVGVIMWNHMEQYFNDAKTDPLDSDNEGMIVTGSLGPSGSISKSIH